MRHLIRFVAGQRNATGIADHARDKRRFTPTSAAQPEIRGYQFVTAKALRGVDQSQHGLQSQLSLLLFGA
jgi:hypothetical protein